ncbi:Rne/Rng family ribonuclease [Lichenicoccus sp.]|uniref:Rne/Rng family ribonuclease n=1 Tax=Lichenicoccus sp. TaxID=2781899 RepID=UPI003D1093C0
MTKRMLIDTTHAEETRVVVLDGNRLEDYDVETSAKKQLKGNIYLAKVIRVEPSLQAAFVEYGGNRHGFLAFGEIHPDYYQIPVADRERLLALQEEEARAEEAREDASDSAGADAADDGRAGPASDASGDDGTDEGANEAGSQAGDAVDAAPSRPDEPAPESMGGEEDGGDDNRTSRQAARFLRQYKIQEVIRRRQILLIQVVKEERGNKGAALTTYISLAGRFCVLMPNSLRGGGVSRKITSAADRKRLKEITNELEIPRGMAMIVRTAGAQRPRPEIKRDCEYLLRLWDDIRDQTLRSVAPALIYEEASLIKRAIRDVYTRDVEEIAVDGEPGWKAAREFMRMLMPANAQKVNLWRDHGQPLFSHYQVEHHLDAMLQPTVQLKSGGYLVINQTEALVAIDVNSGRSTRERGIEETALRTNLEAADELGRQLRLRDLAGLIVVDFIDMESRKHNAMVERRLKDALRSDRARIQIGQISHFGLLEMSRQRLRPSLVESTFVPCPHCAGSGFMRGTDSAALHVLRAIEEEGGKQRHAEILVKVASAVALYVLNHKRVWLGEIERRHRMVIHFASDDSLIPPALKIEGMRPQVAAAPVPAIAVAAERRLPANGVISHGTADDFESVAAFDGETDDVAAEPDDLEDTPGAAGEAPGFSGEGGDKERRRKRRRRSRRGGRRDDAAEPSPPVATQDAEQPDLRGDVPEFVPDLLPAQDGEIAATAGTGPDAGAQAHGGEPAPRKRSRRGGRNRRPAGPSNADAGNAAQSGAIQSGATQSGRVGAGGLLPYGGATPADPFGGAYDIFDVIDQDVAQPAPRAAAEPEPLAPEPAPLPAVTARTVPDAGMVLIAAEPEVAADAAPDAAPAKPKRKRATKAATAEATEAKTKPAPRARAAAKSSATPRARPSKAKPATGAVPGSVADPPADAPEPERPANLIQPILVGATDAPVMRRTGWWKR